MRHLAAIGLVLISMASCGRLVETPSSQLVEDKKFEPKVSDFEGVFRATNAGNQSTTELEMNGIAVQFSSQLEKIDLKDLESDKPRNDQFVAAQKNKDHFLRLTSVSEDSLEGSGRRTGFVYLSSENPLPIAGEEKWKNAKEEIVGTIKFSRKEEFKNHKIISFVDLEGFDLEGKSVGKLNAVQTYSLKDKDTLVLSTEFKMDKSLLEFDETHGSRLSSGTPEVKKTGVANVTTTYKRTDKLFMNTHENVSKNLDKFVGEWTRKGDVAVKDLPEVGTKLIISRDTRTSKKLMEEERDLLEQNKSSAKSTVEVEISYPKEFGRFSGKGNVFLLTQNKPLLRIEDYKDIGKFQVSNFGSVDSEKLRYVFKFSFQKIGEKEQREFFSMNVTYSLAESELKYVEEVKVDDKLITEILKLATDDKSNSEKDRKQLIDSLNGVKKNFSTKTVKATYTKPE